MRWFVLSGLFDLFILSSIYHFCFSFLVFRSWRCGRKTVVLRGVEVGGGWCVAWAIAIPESSVKDSSLGNITHNLNRLTYICTPGSLLTTPGSSLGTSL